MLASLLTVAMLAQPIEWRAWTPALFEQARREKRFVLLDLEAVWCHWWAGASAPQQKLAGVSPPQPISSTHVMDTYYFDSAYHRDAGRNCRGLSSPAARPA